MTIPRKCLTLSLAWLAIFGGYAPAAASGGTGPAPAPPRYDAGFDLWRREMPELLVRTLAERRGERRSAHGFTALQAACLYGPPELIEDLLERGADPNARPDGWEAMGRSGDAPLGLLLANESLPMPVKERMARLLLDAGADPEGPMCEASSMYGNVVRRESPFLMLRGPSCDALRLLLLQYGEQNVNRRWKRIPVDGLSSEYSLAIVQKLLEGGLDPNTAGEKGATLLWQAMMDGDLAATKLLLEYGADANRRSRYFSPPLFRILESRATRPRSAEDALAMARLLLDHGADIHALDNAGRSLLRFYGSRNSVAAEELARFFRQCGAVMDPDAPGMREQLKARARQASQKGRSNKP